jgi:siroheme synthase
MKDLPSDEEQPELAYGSVWLVGAGDGEPSHLYPLAVHALHTADAVIHDPGIAAKILELVEPPRYREAAARSRAIERSVKLAQDGWRVVHLVEGDVMEPAVECAISFAEHNIPFRIVPTGDEPLIGKAPIGLLLVRKSMSVGLGEPSTLAMLIAAAPSDSATRAEQRQPPLSFSMSGLAG